MELQSRCHPVVAAVAVFGLAATVSAQEPDDELMLGTWLAQGESETECFISDASVTLRVFDVSGRSVKTLLDGESYGPGRHDVIWRSRDEAGRVVPAGVYFYRLTAGEYVQTKKGMFMK